jgi:CBS domain containing-hemolysin-like protein
VLKHIHNNDEPQVMCESLSKYYYHLLLICGRFLSLTEIALAGARKVKLKILAESGDERAQKVLIYKNNLLTFLQLHKSV